MPSAAVPFEHRSETFGLETDRPWALNLFQLLFNVPRVYRPLLDGWELQFPGTKKKLWRLVDAGFVDHQPAVIIDTRTGEVAGRPSRPVSRYVTTAKGRRLLEGAREDLRVLEDAFPKTSGPNLAGVRRLLTVCHLQDGNRQFGLSAAHATQLADLAPRTGRWWVRRLVDMGYLRQLDVELPDVREIIPEHWRPTRQLARQVLDVVRAYPSAPQHLSKELRLKRSRFLEDVDPARVGLGGATDYDHDIQAQVILAALLSSSRCAREGVFTVEPRFALPMDSSASPWTFSPDGDDVKMYQPDAEMRERDEDGLRRAVVEYERFQSRRDAWSHIEQFIGWMHTTALPFERGVLRFVVDTEPRVRAYVALIEAFCDYAIDHPERMAPNPITLAVTSTGRIAAAEDPLAPEVWYRIDVPNASSRDELVAAATPDVDAYETSEDDPLANLFGPATQEVRAEDSGPALHPSDASPYDQYFSFT